MNSRESNVVRAEKEPESAEQYSCALHEVSNALTVVLGWLDMASQAETPEEVHKAIAIAREHARRGRVMARRSIGAEVDSVLEQRVAAEVARFAAESVRPQADRHGISIDVNAGSGSGVRIDADGDALQVLTNLLLNAIDFSPRGSEVVIQVERSHSGVEFLVKDKGPGVCETLMPVLFDQGTTTRAHGAGIGLPLSRKLARQNGGDLCLRNPGEVGACFELTWPAAPSAEVMPLSSRSINIEGVRVLMIEDDHSIATLVELSLEARGAHVLSIVQPEQLDEVLSRRPVFDVALLDLSPVKGRVEEILARLRNLSPQAQVVLMSGEPGGVPDELSTHFSAWVRKPFDMEQLVDAVARLTKKASP